MSEFLGSLDAQRARLAEAMDRIDQTRATHLADLGNTITEMLLPLSLDDRVALLDMLRHRFHSCGNELTDAEHQMLNLCPHCGEAL